MLLDSVCQFWSFDMLEPFQVIVQSVHKNHPVHYQKIWIGDLQLVNSRLGFICNTVSEASEISFPVNHFGLAWHNQGFAMATPQSSTNDLWLSTWSDDS